MASRTTRVDEQAKEEETKTNAEPRDAGDSDDGADEGVEDNGTAHEAAADGADQVIENNGTADGAAADGADECVENNGTAYGAAANHSSFSQVMVFLIFL